MIEQKRFTITQDFEEHYRQIRDNGHIIMGCFLEAQAEPIVKLLNELHEENQKCKEYNGILYANHTKTDRELVKQISELKQENEQLKFQLQNTSDQRDEFHRGARENANRVGKLEKENEQLKEKNGQLLAKLKYTCEQINYSEKLREMMK